jgi:hypothetical protein
MHARDRPIRAAGNVGTAVWPDRDARRSAWEYEMSEPTTRQTSAIRFSIRAILVVTFVFAVCMASCMHLVNERERSRRLTDLQKWPRPIQEVVRLSPSIADSVKVYDLRGFMDERKLVSISRQPDVVTRIITDFELVRTDKSHPHARRLLELLPEDRKRPESSYLWYASQGFGSVHQEGVDLFLIATDPTTGDAVMLYNWIF